MAAIRFQSLNYISSKPQKDTRFDVNKTNRLTIQMIVFLNPRTNEHQFIVAELFKFLIGMLTNFMLFFLFFFNNMKFLQISLNFNNLGCFELSENVAWDRVE